MGSADWLRMYAQRLEDEHAPHNLSIGMREAADQMDQQRETVLQLLGQVGQLSDELERTKREAERAQDAHGVRFLNYLEETARLTDEIERLKDGEARLRAALSGVLWMAEEWFGHGGDETTLADDFKKQIEAANAALDYRKMEGL